jgi:sodium transport system permease protein
LKRDDFDEIKAVFGKDLIEVLRDYRTLIVMIIMPVIIYPALLVIPSTVAKHLKSDIKKKHHRIAVIGDAGDAVRFLQDEKTLDLKRVAGVADPDKLLAAKLADIVVSFPDQFPQSVAEHESKAPKVTIFYDARRDQNLIALAEVRMALNQFRASCIQKRFDVLGIHAPQEYHLKFSEIGVSQRDSLASEPVRSLLPFLLFTMLTVSMIYPALDVITGERERNTLPLLLMSPSNRHNIMFGKFLVVSVIGAAALILGLASIFMFIQIGGKGSDELLQLTFPISAMIMCMLVSLPLVITLSSLSILLASWCKTFQQGQGYFVPFLLVSMGASSVCSLPELKLSSGVAFIPVVNTALSLKEVLTGHVDPIWLGISSIVAIAFAVYVTAIASRILDSERLLFGVADSRARRRISGDYFPEVAILCFSVFLLMFYVGQSLQSWEIVVGSLLTQIIVILAPSIYLIKHLRLPIRNTMSLYMPRPLALLGALLVTPLCILTSMLVYNLQNYIVPAPEAFTTMFTRMIVENDKPIWLCLLGIAVAPGLCEELMFRGAVLGLLRPRLKPVEQCLAVGALFGLFHMSIFRVAPTAVLGVVLTALTVWTGSIVPSMLVHILNNSAAILMGKYHLEEKFLSYWPVSVSLGIAGLILLIKFGRRKGDQ